MEIIDLSTPAGLEIAVAIAILMPDEKEAQKNLITLLQASLTGGHLKISKKIISFLGGRITNDGFKIAFKKCLDITHFEDAQTIANSMTEPERNDYLGVVLNKYLEGEDFGKAKETAGLMREDKANKVLTDHFEFLCRERHFLHTHSTANLMTEPARSENLEKSLRGFVKNANIDGAKETSALLKRKLKNRDALTIFYKLMKNKRLKEASDAAATITGSSKYYYLGAVMEEYIFKREIEKAAEIARLISE